MHAVFSRTLPICLALGLACCGPGATALHVIPRPAQGTAGGLRDFYDLPFPSDLRLGKTGALDLSAYPRPGGQLSVYVNAMDGQIHGAGPSAAIFFRFDGPIDPGTLPRDAAESLQPGASAFVVDITETSPTYGRRTPVVATYSDSGGKFMGPHGVALQPFPGLPLRESTTYAAIVTTDLHADARGPIFRHPDLDLLLAETPPPATGADATVLQAAWQRYAPLRDYLDRYFRKDVVVGATIFTTQDATSMMLRLRRAVYQHAPLPRATDFRYVGSHDGLCHVYEGTYITPNFQQGEVPYFNQGGDLRIDDNGDPQIIRMEPIRFALSVPNGPMPANGWPVALYAHGTGGDYMSFVGENIDLRAASVEMDGRIAARMAVISIDQVLHGPRDPTGSSPDLTFFNLKNIRAARDNPRQGAADDFQLVRLVKAFFTPAAPGTGREIRFDSDHMYFVGHSQGGLTGPLFLSAEPEIRAAVLSGAGALLVLSLLHKTEPVDVAGLVESLLEEPARPDHPFLNLLQAFFEPGDPNNYGRLLFREPPPGAIPKSIFQTLGVTDHYTPIPNLMAFALSMGVQPVLPRILDMDGLALAGLFWGTAPVYGNVSMGQATGVLRQYPQKGSDDGHFVIFDQWDARHDWSRFLATDITTGLARIP